MQNDSIIFDTPGNNSKDLDFLSDISVWSDSDVLTLLALPLVILLLLLIVVGVISNGLLACLFVVCLDQSSTASRLYRVFAVTSFVQSAVTIPMALRSLPGVMHENWTEAECKASRGGLVYFVNLYTFLIIMANWCRMRRALRPCAVRGTNLYVKGTLLAALAAIISIPSFYIFGKRTKFHGPHSIVIDCTISQEFANSMLPRIMVAFNCGIYIVMVLHLLMVQGCIEHRRRQMLRPSFVNLGSSTRFKSFFGLLSSPEPTENAGSKQMTETSFDWAQITMFVEPPTELEQDAFDMSWIADAQDDKEGSFSLRGSIAARKHTPSLGPSEDEPSCYTMNTEHSFLSVRDAGSANRDRHSTMGHSDESSVSRTFKRWRTARREKASVVVMAWSALVNLLISVSRPASTPATPKLVAVYEAAKERKLFSKRKKKSSPMQTMSLITGLHTESPRRKTTKQKISTRSQTSGYQTGSQTSRHQKVSQSSRHTTGSQTSGHQTGSQTSRHKTERQTSAHQTESQTSGRQKDVTATESDASTKSTKTDQMSKAAKDNLKRKAQRVILDVAKETKRTVSVTAEKTGKSVNVPITEETTDESEFSEGRGGPMTEPPSDMTSDSFQIAKAGSSEQLHGTSSLYALKNGPSIRSRFSAVEMQVTRGVQNTADTIIFLSLVCVAIGLPHHLLALVEVFDFIPFGSYHSTEFVFHTLARYSVLIAPMAFMTLIFGVNKTLAMELSTRGLFCLRLFCPGLCTKKPSPVEVV